MTPRLRRFLLRGVPPIVLSVLALNYIGLWAVGMLFLLALAGDALMRRRRAARS